MATNTFLFTDIAGSTRLWQENAQAMEAALRAHDEVTLSTVERHGGRVFKHTGDGVAAIFESARPALEAAADLQRSLARTAHPEIGPLRVRIGIHSGEAQERDGDYFGLCVTRAARLMAAGHGGQILVSFVTERLAGADDLPLRDLGESRLRDLSRAERIFQLSYEGEPESFPPLGNVDAAPNNLPTFPTSFVGRDQEMAELNKLVHGSRLVTITGVGGAGKTRVALQTAAELASEFAGGVWLVELAAVTDPAAVDSAMLSALSLQQPAGVSPRQALLEHLAKAQAILVLVDNCEHMIDAVADLVGDILAHSPGTTVIATSRELLGVPGEVSFRLRSMGLPPRDADAIGVRSADAVKLFVERGAAARSDFRLSRDNSDHVVEICRRLDGMPLALELAAARLRTFSTDQIASHLDQRFRLLTGGSRTALPRQQTLTATIEWSYRLLANIEAELLRRLSVFQDGFTFDSVTAVCSGDSIEELDVLELLPGLVDKSLVAMDDDEGQVRYRLLETLRQFARDRLDETGRSEDWRRRHGAHFAGFGSETSVERMFGPGGDELIRRLRPEIGNLRQAMSWAIGAGDFGVALGALRVYKRISAAGGTGWSEGLAWSSQVFELDRGELTDEQRGLLLYLHGTSLALAGQLDGAIGLLTESVDIQRRVEAETGDPDLTPELPMALNWLSLATLWNGGGGERNEVYTGFQEEILELARRRNERVMIALALANLAHHRDPGGDPGRARQLFEEAEGAIRSLGSEARLAGLAWQRAGFEFHQGELEEARRRLEYAEHVHEASGAEAEALEARLLGLHCAVELGEWERIEDYRQALPGLFDDENRASLLFHQIAIALGAGIDAALGRSERVAIAAGASKAIAERGRTLRWDYVDYFERLVENSRSVLDEVTFRRLSEQGVAKSPDEIIAFLLDL
ncbi:MAG TPA: adenylate/guanylate cyclase domain-containing protein [Acidimicrobiia bacterium]|nr:adenylate/guanylate cyclase domain-containing protein [Acidimicrobiia bacterium]